MGALLLGARESPNKALDLCRVADLASQHRLSGQDADALLHRPGSLRLCRRRASSPVRPGRAFSDPAAEPRHPRSRTLQ